MSMKNLEGKWDKSKKNTKICKFHKVVIPDSRNDSECVIRNLFDLVTDSE